MPYFHNNFDSLSLWFFSFYNLHCSSNLHCDSHIHIYSHKRFEDVKAFPILIQKLLHLPTLESVSIFRFVFLCKGKVISNGIVEERMNKE